jgi:hypothetical protein
MSLTDFFSGNAEEAAKQQISGLKTGQAAATNQLKTGLGYSENYTNQALSQYDPYKQTAQNAYSLYGDALGLNGSTGTANAQSAYTTSPGYQFQLDQGTQAAMRAASAQGLLASGNTSTDLVNYAQGLASQDYGSWLDRLSGLGTQGLQIANNSATIQQNQGQTGYNTYNSLANLDWNTATGIGNAKAQQAQAEGQGLLGAVSLGTKLLGSFI